MPIVVCDSSTLIHLARIGRLSLLRDFHGKIIIVPAVWNEVVEEGQGKPGSSEIRDACESGWIEVIRRIMGHWFNCCSGSCTKVNQRQSLLRWSFTQIWHFWMKAMLEEWPRFTGSRCPV